MVSTFVAQTIAFGSLESVKAAVPQTLLLTLNKDSQLFSCAASRHRVDVIEWFFSMGLEANAIYEQGFTLLHIASQLDEREIIVALMNRGAVHMMNDERNYPIHMASVQFCSENLDLFAGTIDEFDQDGMTLLMTAIECEDFHCVKRLLAMGAQFHFVDAEGDTALHMSCFSTLEIAQLLVESGADLDSKNAYQETPLDIALECDRDIASFFLEMGAQHFRASLPRRESLLALFC